MTAHRAAYFMERFKREEKLLGPNEQVAIDYVLELLQFTALSELEAPHRQIVKQMEADGACGRMLVPNWLLKSTQELAKSIVRDNYPDVPQFEVLDTLEGVIGQIDDMICGMVRTPVEKVVQPTETEFLKRLDLAYEKQNGYVSSGDPMFYNLMQHAKAWARWAWYDITEKRK